MQTLGQNNRVFDRLASPLAEIRSHRVGGISEQRNSPEAPAFYWLAIIDVVAQNRCILGRVNDFWNGLVPISKLGLERAAWVRVELVRGGVHICKPINSFRVEPNRTKASPRSPGFKCIAQRENGDREGYDSPITGVAGSPLKLTLYRLP